MNAMRLSMKFLFSRKAKNWSNFIESGVECTRKEALMDYCQKLGVSIYVDDANESSGVYSKFRSVTSEAELERRLNSKVMLNKASQANLISIFALFLSLSSFLISICTAVFQNAK